MTDSLTQLKKFSDVVADTGDINSILAYQPKDVTTNPSLILQAASLPEYQHLIREALEYSESITDVLDALAVIFGRELLQHVPGVVSTEIDARLSYDTEQTVARARAIIALYKQYGIDASKVLIKIAATWPGIEAARVLEKEGIRCNMTLVFSKEQAIACAQAGAYLISPFVGRVKDWYDSNQMAYQQHPGVQLVQEIHQSFKQAGYKTVIMAASFRAAEEVLDLAGCDRLTIPPKVLAALQELTTAVTAKLTTENLATGAQQPETLTASSFDQALAQNKMAKDKLNEGIERFVQDTISLESQISAQL